MTEKKPKKNWKKEYDKLQTLLQEAVAKSNAAEQAHYVACVNLKSLQSHVSARDGQIANLKSQVDAIRSDLERAEALVVWYDLESLPESPLTEVREKLKQSDAFTLDAIVDYLKHDLFLIVKNLASVTNSENAATVIAYRDGAIARNESLIKELSKVRKEFFPNRATGEMQMKVK